MSWLSSRRVVPWLFLAPVLLFALAFVLLPIGFSAYVSLTSWDSLSPPRWVGPENYVHLLGRDPIFLRTLWQTFYFALGTLAVGVPAALGLAFALSRDQEAAKSLQQAALLVSVLPVTVVFVALQRFYVAGLVSGGVKG